MAAVIGGMPDVLMGWIGGLFGGGLLPPDAEAWLSSSGPIVANDNGVNGFNVNVNGSFAGLLALLDVEAGGNGVIGVNANVESPIGIAVGFVGSSKDLMDVLQLGASVMGLLGLDVPAIPDSPMGPARLNENGVGGLNMQVQGEQLAVGAVLGVQANSNEAFNGVNMDVMSSGAAIGLMGNIQADGNETHGVSANVAGDFLGLGALLDIHAVDNGIFGIDLSLSGNAAIGLVASTDPLRALVDALNDGLAIDPPLVVPGTPFGPVVTSGNGLMGINAVVQGESLAAGVFLDIEANNNEFLGLSAVINSTDGQAFGVFGSSDMLFELIPPMLAEAIFGDPDGIPVPDYTPMGDMDLSGNRGGGLWATVEGRWGASLLAGGISANDNLDISPPPGHGMMFGLASEEGPVFAGLMNLTANGNAGFGIGLDAVGDAAATVALIQSQANGNADRGVLINAGSSDDNVYAILAGVEALGNARQGIDLGLAAAGDLGVAVTAVTASDNLRQGLRLNAAAGDEAFVWVGDLALDDLRGEFGDYDFFGASDALYGFMPTGPSVFNNNGWDPGVPVDRVGMRLNVQAVNDITVVAAGGNAFIGNSGSGLHLDLDSAGGDIQTLIEVNEMSGNDLHGLRITADTGSGDIDIGIDGVQASDNERNGIFVTAESADGNVTLALDNVTASDNDRDGIRAVLRASASSPNLHGVRLSVNDSEALNNGRWDIYGRLYYGVVGGSTVVDFADFNRDTENVGAIAE